MILNKKNVQLFFLIPDLIKLLCLMAYKNLLLNTHTHTRIHTHTEKKVLPKYHPGLINEAEAF